MAEHAKPIDISDTPELLRLAEEVRRDGAPRVLCTHDEDLVMIVPLPQPRTRRRGRVKTQADYEAFRRSAGGWADLDTDTLIKNIYEDRKRSSRPPVDL
jgi:hypothetical protein